MPISTRPRWGKDYADPVTFIEPLFRENIIPTGNTNYSLVGLTQAQANGVKVTGTAPACPRSTRASELRGARRAARGSSCYAALDRQLTTKVVPWIPYLWRDQLNVLGPDVATWTFDQNAGLAGFGHVSLKSS